MTRIIQKTKDSFFFIFLIAALTREVLTLANLFAKGKTKSGQAPGSGARRRDQELDAVSAAIPGDVSRTERKAQRQALACPSDAPC